MIDLFTVVNIYTGVAQVCLYSECTTPTDAHPRGQGEQMECLSTAQHYISASIRTVT